MYPYFGLPIFATCHRLDNTLVAILNVLINKLIQSKKQILYS